MSKYVYLCNKYWTLWGDVDDTLVTYVNRTLNIDINLIRPMFVWNYLCQTSQKKLKFLYVVVPGLKVTNAKYKVSKKIFRGNTAN